MSKKDKHQPRPPKGTETPRSPRASNKKQTPATTTKRTKGIPGQAEAPERQKINASLGDQTPGRTNPEAQNATPTISGKGQRGHRTHANRSHQEEEKAEAAQRRKTSANTATQGKKTNTPGRAEATKDKNTPGCRSLGAPQDKHQQQRPASKDHSQPHPPRGRETERRGQDQQDSKTKDTPRGAKGQTADSNHNQRQTLATSTNTTTQRAESQEQANAPQQPTRRWRGDGVCQCVKFRK